MSRTDETWHRLRDWTSGQTPSERLAGHVLAADDYSAVDPSHPLGGPDTGKDARATKDGHEWIMAVYFPRGEHSFAEIKKKFVGDLAEARRNHEPHGLVFVTNQELRLGERDTLKDLGDGIEIDLYHLERVMHVLDRPGMAQIRKQYLDIDPGPVPLTVDLHVGGSALHLTDADAALDRFVSNTRDTAHRKLADRIAAVRDQVSFAIPRPSISDMYGTPQHRARTPEQLDQELDEWERTVRAKWPTSVKYLAARAWNGVSFHISNTGKVFLNDVQVVLTITNAQVLDHEELDTFDRSDFVEGFEKSAPASPSYFDPMAHYIPPSFTPVGYPVEWKNLDDSTARVTITLDKLRPRETFDSDDDDIVLLALASEPEVAVEWFVTAQTYGEPYDGEAITIPVAEESFTESFAAVKQ